MGLLRIFLALSVAMQHAGGSFGISGSRAVEVFFIISGFYMTLIVDSGKYQDYKMFFTNRLLKIFPMYVFVLALTFLVSIVLIKFGIPTGKTALGFYVQYQSYLQPFSFLVFGLSNILIFGQDLLRTIFSTRMRDGKPPALY